MGKQKGKKRKELSLYTILPAVKSTSHIMDWIQLEDLVRSIFGTSRKIEKEKYFLDLGTKKY